jgi:NAD(P)-dependent dehydrogenase (short-subunit alcohol dehydrogenase family)
MRPPRLVKTPLEEWMQVIDANLNGPFILTRLLARREDRGERCFNSDPSLDLTVIHLGLVERAVIQRKRWVRVWATDDLDQPWAFRLDRCL